MPFLLLLLVSGVALAASRRTSTRKPKPRIKTIRLPPDRLVATFGAGAGDEYPAPYRWRDVQAIVDVLLAAASETSPNKRPYYDGMRERQQLIAAANLPNWRKSYGYMLSIVFPTLAAALLWHWWRPTSNTKADRFNAIAQWAGLFLAMPNTATASASIQVDVANSSLISHASAFLDGNTPLRRGLSPQQQRRCLYDLFSWMRRWPHIHPEFGGGESIDQLVTHAGVRMHDLNAVFPITDPPALVIEGNLKAVDEIVWLANARVQGSIRVDFEEGAAIAALVVQVISAIVSAVVPIVGAELGAALRTGSDALSKLAYMVADGEISADEYQALAGVGITIALDQAGIRLEGIDDGLRAAL